jgi:hypothetical protein
MTVTLKIILDVTPCCLLDKISATAIFKLFITEDGSSRLSQNISVYEPGCMMSHSRRQYLQHFICLSSKFCLNQKLYGLCSVNETHCMV